MLKTIGYLISTLSVLLLGVVSWRAAAGDAVLRVCLVAGMAAAVLGMFCRWLSYEIEKKHRSAEERRGVPVPRTLSMSVPHKEIGRG